MTQPTASGRSDMISDMKAISWPLAVTVMAALCAVVVTQIWGNGDTSDVLTIVLLLLGAYNTAEIREVKANTNGATRSLLEENANYRRQLADITNRALESPPLGGPPTSPTS